MSPAIEVFANDLSDDAEWDSMCDIIPDEPYPKSCGGEATKVLEEWTSDEDEEDSKRDLNIMEIDHQIGTNFLCDDLFFFASSPVTPQEEHGMRIAEFETPHLTAEHLKFAPLPPFPGMDQKYCEAFKKLANCMRQSEETRKSLTMKTEKADEKYERRESITTILNRIENSSRQLQTCFGDLHIPASMEV